MTVPPYVLVIILVVFGFLSGSTLYFYNQSRITSVSRANSQKISFTGQLPGPGAPTTQDQALIANTKPDAPQGRLSYPSNVYIVQPNESVFVIAQKFQIDSQLIVKANGLADANVIQAGFPLVIPALDHDTDFHRVNFTHNDNVASSLNLQLRDQSASDYFDPVKVAIKDAIPYFGLTNQNSYSLSIQDQSKGTAVVEVKQDGNRVALVGLFQPKVKGVKGLWAVLYVEGQS